METNDYIYLKHGINVFRFPKNHFNDEETNINLIENLVWLSPDDYKFVRNEVAYDLGENTDIRKLNKSENLSKFLPKRSNSNPIEYIDSSRPMSEIINSAVNKSMSEYLKTMVPNIPDYDEYMQLVKQLSAARAEYNKLYKSLKPLQTKK